MSKLMLEMNKDTFEFEFSTDGECEIVKNVLERIGVLPSRIHIQLDNDVLAEVVV